MVQVQKLARLAVTHILAAVLNGRAWDLIFDDIDFDWSSTGEPGKMDFENIATHELGHSVGMGDLYETVCSEETMYGFAANGETKKRDLNTDDITGINKLY